LQLETNQDGLKTHCHELGYAESCNLHSTDPCQELATCEQLTYTSNKVHISEDEVTESAVLDNRSQLVHDAAVHNNAVPQKDSLILNVCNVDLCHAPPVLSSSDDVFKDQLRRNGLGEFNGESCAETSGDHVSCDSLNTEEINVDEKQCSDVSEDTERLNTYQKLIKKETDCSSEIESTDEDASLINDGNCLASEYFPRSNYEYMILLDSWYPGISGGESCYKDAHSSIVPDRCSADVDVTANKAPDVDLMWHPSAVSLNSKVTEDTEIDHMLPDPDCENSKFADIPVEGRAQHIKLTLNHGEVDEQIAQDRLASLFSCILDKTQNLSKGFPSAAEFPQNTDCLNAGIYASLGGMELRDDMELIPVDDAKTDRKHNMERTDTVCDTNDYVNSMNNLASVNNESSINAGIWNSASLGGMELCDTMELIPVDDEKTGKEHSKDGTEAIYDIDSQIYDDASEQLEVSQLTTNSLEMHKTASTSHNEKQLETVSRDSNDVEMAQHDVEITSNCDALDKVDGAQTWPLDSDIKLLIAQEPTSLTSPQLQYTNTGYDVGQKLQYDLMLTPTEEVFDGNNENSEPTDKAEGRSSTALASASDSVNSITEMQNVDTLVSSEMINTDTASSGLTKTDSVVSNNAPEMVDSYVTINRTLEDVENGEHETNTSFASDAYNTHSARADLEFLINAGFIENCVIEHHLDLPMLNNEETSSTVHYATEDSQFPVYEQSEKQLELFTVNDTSPKTQRLELDDLTLTVTCFIPEESDEMDDSALGDNGDSEYVDMPNVSSNRKLTANDPSVSNDLGHYMDHNVVGAGNIIPKRRSSEFMLSYLGPIDEAAEFTDDADEDTDDLVPDKSRSLQPDDSLNDIKTDPSNNKEQEMVSNINASPTVEDAYRLCHEPTENMQHDDVAAASSTEEPRLGSSLSEVHDFGVAVDNSCKTKCFDDKEQITYEESRSSMETVERNNVNVYDRHNPWFSFDQQDSVGQVMSRNEYLSEDSVDDTARITRAATDVEAVTHLHDNSSKHLTTAEHETLTNVSLPLHAGSEDSTGSTDNIFVPFAADSAGRSAVYSVAKNAESSVSNFDGEHFLDANAFTQNKVQEAGGEQEKLYNTHQNAEYKKRVDLDTEIFSNAESLLGKNSAVTHAAELEYSGGPWKQHAEAALQQTESPVLRTNNIRTALDAILQGHLVRSRDKQDAIVEQPLLQTATSDRDMSHSFVSVLRKSPSAGVKSSVELEEPAIDAVTDFESILEQLHAAENAARND